MVKNSRTTAYGEDTFMAVDLKYGSKPKKDDFFMFPVTCDVDDKAVQKVLAFLVG